MDPERALRQVLLVGVDGQAAIERAVARVPATGLASEVATLYAVRAGFARVEPMSPRASDEAGAAAVDAAAREVLEGSRSAMRAVLSALAPTRAVAPPEPSEES